MELKPHWLLLYKPTSAWVSRSQVKNESDTFVHCCTGAVQAAVCFRLEVRMITFLCVRMSLSARAAAQTRTPTNFQLTHDSPILPAITTRVFAPTFRGIKSQEERALTLKRPSVKPATPASAAQRRNSDAEDAEATQKTQQRRTMRLFCFPTEKHSSVRGFPSCDSHTAHTGV